MMRVVWGLLVMLVTADGVLVWHHLSRPRIDVSISPEQLVLDSVRQGPFTREFTVTNGGNRTVTLGDPVTSCTCTKVTVEDRVLEPGATSAVTAHFRSGAKGEYLAAQFRIPWACGDVSGDLSASLRARIRPHVSAYRAAHDAGADGALVYLVQTHYPPSVSVERAWTVHGQFDVDVGPAEGDRVRLVLRPRQRAPDDADRPSSGDWLCVSTTSEWKPYLRVPIPASSVVGP